MAAIVSVIIPVHNSAAFLPSLFHCLNEMTFSDWECILINNGSSDNSLALLMELSSSDPRFIVIDSDIRGVSNARNAGLKMASGSFIQFLDADDLLEKDKILIHKSFLDSHPDVGLVFSNAAYFKSESPTLLMDPPWTKASLIALSGEGKVAFRELLKGNRLVISAPLFRRNFIAETDLMDLSLTYNEDWDFWLRLARHGAKFRFLDDERCKSLIRLHNSSASANLTGMYASELGIYLRESSDLSNSASVRRLAKFYFCRTWLEILKRKITGASLDLVKLINVKGK